MNESCMLWNFVDVGYVWGPSILLTGGLCGGLFRVVFFGGDQSKPWILEVPIRFIPTYPDHYVFQENFPQSIQRTRTI